MPGEAWDSMAGYGPSPMCKEGTTALELKETGNRHFRALRLNDAIDSYEAALDTDMAASDHLPRILLQNIAAAALQDDSPRTAFFYAGVVACLTPHQDTWIAFLRAAKGALLAGSAPPLLPLPRFILRRLMFYFAPEDVFRRVQHRWLGIKCSSAHTGVVPHSDGKNPNARPSSQNVLARLQLGTASSQCVHKHCS